MSGISKTKQFNSVTYSGDSSVEKLQQKKPRKKQSNEESKIQQVCVKWFNMQYSRYNYILFAIPNGGKRGVITASILKSEGTLAGVADFFLSVPKVTYNKETTKHGLFIEMKTKDGRQSESQKEFQKKVELVGYQYTICRSVEEFIKTINDYL